MIDLVRRNVVGQLTGLKLQLGKPRVEAACRCELRMRALLDDAARIHYQDTVAGQYGRQPVRDDERGTLRHQARDGAEWLPGRCWRGSGSSNLRGFA